MTTLTLHGVHEERVAKMHRRWFAVWTAKPFVWHLPLPLDVAHHTRDEALAYAAANPPKPQRIH